jgi:hypothetical protein
MKPNKVHGIVHVDLAMFRKGTSYDSMAVDRLMREFGESLPEGSYVRIRVHELKPVGVASWWPLPLVLQVEAANPWVMRHWVDFLEDAA